MPTLSQARGNIDLFNERKDFKDQGLARQASTEPGKIWDEKAIKGIPQAPNEADLRTPEMYAPMENYRSWQELGLLVAWHEA